MLKGGSVAKKALIPIADGSEEIEAVCIIDTLRRAEVDVTAASVMGRLEITAARGTMIVADALIEDCDNETYDVIALPGGIPGAEHLRDCAALIQIVTAQRDSGRLYGAICASPAVALLPHGLVAGRRATCFPSYLPVLAEAADVEAVEDRVVVDGNLVTSRGPGTAIEFALMLIEILFSDPAKAVAIGERMLVR
ncbi:MAG: DJ-1/PfpI family protein [Anaerolineae bacterium]|nr:DJ-1/PfpI family protein [Anaerolineae bacterium]